MKLLMISLDHHDAPVAVRERFALDAQRIADLTMAVRRVNARAELVALSTCNRVEVYIGRAELAGPNADQLTALIAEACGEPVGLLRAHSRYAQHQQAAAHLMRVACGLESLALGEPEILGQVRRAYTDAIGNGTVGPMLHQVFQTALRFGKQSRSAFALNQGRSSIASIAVDSADEQTGGLTGKRVLVIGAGDVSRCVIDHVLDRQPGAIAVACRSTARARAALTAQRQRENSLAIVGWEALGRALDEAEVIITATSSPHAVLHEAHFTDQRCEKLVIDLAMPRDVDPRVDALAGVTVLDLDDLEQTAAQTRAHRCLAAEQIAARIDALAESCLGELSIESNGELIRRLRGQSHDVASAETRRAVSRIAGALELDDAQRQQLAALMDQHSRRLTNKLLHQPVSKLNDRQNPPMACFAAAAARYLLLDDGQMTEPSGDQPGVVPNLVITTKSFAEAG